MEEFAVGATFADHVIRGVAGRGGMGVVYRAMHIPLRRQVALKVIAPGVSGDAAMRARFRREFEAAASIEHESVIPIYHAGEEEGLLFVTMRYVEGTDLARLIAVEARLDPALAARFVAQIADGLDAAHARGVVHRDVKPANVLIDGRRALLTDFGLTKPLAAAETMTETGTVIGTLDYTPPEQLEGGNVDARSDVYSLGCVLFQALTGRVPYPRDEPVAKMWAHVSAPLPSVLELAPDVPPELDAVVRRALAKDPAQRFASAGELGQAALAAVGVRSPVSDSIRPEPQPAAGVPLPAPLGTVVAEQALVGRAGELEELERRLAAAEAGERQTVLISGEPGIGKTRLAAELAKRAHERGAVVLYGRSDVESLVPYQPFIAGMQHFIAHQDTLSVPPELEPEMSELARFVPALRRRVTVPPVRGDERESRYRMFEAVTRVIASLARNRLTVIVLDDLQWADSATVLMLTHLLRDPEPVKLLVLVTVREGDPAPALAPLLDQSPPRLRLRGLDAADTVELAGELGSTAVRRLQKETGGNPYFLIERLRSLQAALPDDAGPQDVERALDTLTVPENVKELIGSRVARLSDAARDVLSVGSVIGAEFRFDVVEQLVDESEQELIGAVEEAVAAGLLREVSEDADRFAFSHALVRDAVYERQSSARRVRRHRRIGEALEALDAPPAEVAHHFFEARVADKASVYDERAAREAAAALAYEEAMAHYLRALEGADATRRGALLLGLGHAQVRAGDPAGRAMLLQAADAARRERQPDLLAHAALNYAHHAVDGSERDREGIALLEESLDALQDDRESALAVKVRARLASTLHFHGEVERRDLLSASALEMARSLGDPGTLALALESRLLARFHIAYVDERLQLSQELLALAREQGDRELEALALQQRVAHLFEAAQVDAARASADELARLAEALRLPFHRYIAACWAVLWAELDGDFERAERLSQPALELGRRAQARDAEGRHGAQRLGFAYWRGRMADLTPVIPRLIERDPHIAIYRPMLTLALLEAGETEPARHMFEQAAAGDFEGMPRDMLWFSAICFFAEVCARLHDAPRAAVLYELIAPYRTRVAQIGTIACWGPAERYLGLLARTMGDGERAAEHFQAALAVCEATGMQHVIPVLRAELSG